MNRFIVFVLFNLLLGNLYSQQTDTAIYRVNYQLNHIRDTNNRKEVYSENMMLLIGSSTSLYKSYDAYKLDSQRAVQTAALKESGRAVTGDNIRSSINLSRNATKTEFLKTFLKGMITQKEVLFSTGYIFDDSLPVINWDIQTDKRVIASFNCQKAIGVCRGRTYIAWFCPDLPVADGPWKLTGLPGLILQAEDTRQEVSFIFTGLTVISDKKIPLSFSDKNLIKSSKKDFVQLAKAAAEDPVSFFKSSLESRGLGSDLKITAPAGYKPPTNNGYNNPIEIAK